MTILKNILVPLDGSPLAEAALPYARALATRSGARLTLVRTAHYASLLGDVAVDQYRAMQTAENYLNQLVEQLTRDGYAAQAGVPFGGSAAGWIVEEIEMRHADLVVMATHDRVGVDRLVHGSVAETVVHRSAVPVMLVRAADAEHLAQRFAESEPVFVVSLDGSEFAEGALPVASGIARVTGGRLVLVGVTLKAGQLFAGQGGAIATYTAHEIDEGQASARAYLEGVAPEGNVQIDLRSGDASAEIAAAAQEHAAAAVIMATHGRTGVIRSMLGSVAGGVVHNTPLPVILVHVGAVKVQVREQTAAAFAD